MRATFTSAAVGRHLLLLNTLGWLVFATIIAAGRHPSIPDSELVRWGMCGLALMTAAILTVAWVFLGKGSKLAFYVAIGMLALLAILTVTDEFGIADFAVLIVILLPLGLLLKDRDRYLGGAR